jgi:hypothetical protein
VSISGSAFEHSNADPLIENNYPAFANRLMAEQDWFPMTIIGKTTIAIAVESSG